MQPPGPSISPPPFRNRFSRKDGGILYAGRSPAINKVSRRQSCFRLLSHHVSLLRRSFRKPRPVSLSGRFHLPCAQPGIFQVGIRTRPSTLPPASSNPRGLSAAVVPWPAISGLKKLASPIRRKPGRSPASYAAASALHWQRHLLHAERCAHGDRIEAILFRLTDLVDGPDSRLCPQYRRAQRKNPAWAKEGCSTLSTTKEPFTCRRQKKTRLQVADIGMETSARRSFISHWGGRCPAWHGQA